MERFVYSTHRTREDAEAALADYCAEGRISEGEGPTIERRWQYRPPQWESRPVYCVMFPC